jgi:hypothetical protein
VYRQRGLFKCVSKKFTLINNNKNVWSSIAFFNYFFYFLGKDNFDLPLKKGVVEVLGNFGCTIWKYIAKH